MSDLRSRKKHRTRIALAVAALRLFEERGFDETTIDDIAAAADVAPRTFHRYFGSKEDVFLVDPERKLEIIRTELGNRPTSEALLAGIRRTLRAIATDYAADEVFVRLQYRVGLREPKLVAHGYVYQVRWEDAIAEAVAADLGVDATADVRARVTAHVTVSAARSAVSAWLAQPAETDAATVMDATFDLVEPALAVLLAGPPPPAPSPPRG
jgi:AcrR family transcriptional regulator